MDANYIAGQPRVSISREAILHNARIIRGRLSHQARICAVIKADAYGHGAGIVADTLANFTCDDMEGPAVDSFAVVSMEEAEGIEHHGLPIYVLRPVENVYVGRQRDAFEAAIMAGWVLTVTSPAAAMDLARIAMACGQRAAVQVMIDTGQNREGAALNDLPAILRAIESLPTLRLAALCTHFASSEEPDNPLNNDQLQRFRIATDLNAAGNPRIIRHAANSGAVFFAPASHLDMVRPGIAIYGIDPTCRPSVERPLRPVLKWVAPLAMVREVPPGACVGYNHSWQAQRHTRIGLVPVGYADGYSRSFSNRAAMIVHGRPARVVGRVSMDYTTVDLSDVPDAAVGDEVTVLDDDPLSPASVYRLAELADTIPYEIFCRIGQRMKRVADERRREGEARRHEGTEARTGDERLSTQHSALT